MSTLSYCSNMDPTSITHHTRSGTHLLSRPYDENVSTLDTRPLVDRIADELRAQVIDGRLTPGRRVRQEDLAAQLNVSRTPLREALRRLEAEEWFVSHSRQGVVVADLSLREVQELAVARLTLEPTAARVAALTHDDEARDRVMRIVEQRHSSDIEFRPDEFEVVNREFHLEIYGAFHGESHELAKQTRLVWQKFARYRRYYWKDHKHVCLSSDAHRKIADLWCRRDGDGAELATAEHIFDAIADQIRTLGGGDTSDPALLAIASRYGLDSQLTEVSQTASFIASAHHRTSHPHGLYSPVSRINSPGTNKP
jgi:DNA-binding GntR family transcriptional regulator